MALHLYRSNRLEFLAAVVGELLQSHGHPEDPFEPVRIVVGSRGVARWLRHRLAERLGVCANVRFPFPAATMDGLIDEVVGRGPAADPWAPDALAWSVLNVLREQVEHPELAWFLPYLSDDGVVTPRQWGIARQVADVFDRYITYRPEVAVAWSRGEATPTLPADLAWQPMVWQALAQQLEVPHRAQRTLQAIEAMRSEVPSSRWANLRVFGVSSLPPTWLDLLGAASRHIDIDLFLLCPSMQYWADLKRRYSHDLHWRQMDRDALSEHLHPPPDASGDPSNESDTTVIPLGPSMLLSAMGRQGAEFQLILESQPDDYESRRLDLFHDPAHNAASDELTVLRALQSDIFQATQHRRPVPSADDSVRLHACHGPTRQVEVLRDQLLHLFDAHPDLHPRDVLVMTPDITTFAPLVSAVFDQGRPYKGTDGWGSPGAPNIPFEIADLSARETNPVAEALLRLLDLATGRVRASEVLDWLGLPPVRLRFGLPAESMPQVAEWLAESGVRWGIDAEHRAAHDMPEDDQNTWAFGIDRLLLGVCLPDEDDLTFAGIAPYDPVEGGQALLVGRVVHALRTLFAELRELRTPRPPGEWVDRLTQTVSCTTQVGEDDAWLAVAVNDALATLAEQAASAAERPISVGVMKSVLAERFARVAGHAKEHSGAVTFCAMAPMRSVPYRVVCLLGLDDGALPRPSRSVAFDWIDRAPRPGDRDLRDEDRYLFLEAILAARDHLHVLWTGRDVRSNEERPPATPLAELIGVLDQSYDTPSDAPSMSQRLTTWHALQAYSQSNFNRSGPPTSYDTALLAGARASASATVQAAPFFTPRAVAGEAPSAVTLDELIRFLENPSAWLLRRRLAVDLTDREDAAQDREPVELGGLERWQVWNQVVEARLDGASTDDLYSHLAARGVVPLGYAGERVTQVWSEAADTALANVGVLEDNGSVRPRSEPVRVDLIADGTPLTGTLTRCWGDHLIHVNFGREGGKRWIRPWVELLAWTAMGGTPQAVVAWKGDALLGLDTPEDAHARLSELVTLFRVGCQTPVPLFPKTSLAFVKALKPNPLDAMNEDAAVESAVGKAFGQWSGYLGGDGDDPHTHKLYDGRYGAVLPDGTTDPLFVQASVQVFAPLLAVRKTKTTVRKWVS